MTQMYIHQVRKINLSPGLGVEGALSLTITVDDGRPIEITLFRPFDGTDIEVTETVEADAS